MDRQQLAKRIRERLVDIGDEMEPEDAYDTVADELNIELEDLLDILEDDSLLETDAESCN